VEGKTFITESLVPFSVAMACGGVDGAGEPLPGGGITSYLLGGTEGQEGVNDSSGFLQMLEPHLSSLFFELGSGGFLTFLLLVVLWL